MFNSKTKPCLLFSIFLLLYFSFCPIYSQNKPIQIVKPETPLMLGWEDYLNKRPVTGGGDVRVGLISDKAENINDPTSFFVLLPSTDLEVLHVIIKSLDGKYQAKNLFYNIQNNNPGILKLELPTQYKKQLSKYNTLELSILTMLKKTRESKDAENYLISSWKNSFNSKEFILNVNSRTPIRLITTDINNKKIQNLNCVKINNDSENVVSYSFRCYIPREVVNDSTHVLLLKNKGKMKGVTENLLVPIIIE